VPRASTKVATTAGATPPRKSSVSKGDTKGATRTKRVLFDLGTIGAHGRYDRSDVPPAPRARAAKAGQRRTGQEDPLAQVVSAFMADARRGGLVETLSRLADPKAFGAKLAVIAEAQATWEAALGRYLTVNEVTKVLGASRQAVHQRIERGTLLAIDLAGQVVLPAYQFEDRAVRPDVVRTLKLLRTSGLSREGVVSWFASPQPELEGARPADWLGKDPTALYEAARHTAGSLGH
jgi:hypothetical protein